MPLSAARRRPAADRLRPGRRRGRGAPRRRGAGHPGGWAAYVAGVPWALRKAGHAVGGLDVASTAPCRSGAGLSSSAALECAVAAAASDLCGLGLLGPDEGRARLAAACVEAENTIAQAPTGGMDQSAALLAEAGHALLLDCRDHSTEQVPFDLDGPGLALLVIDTRAEHALVDGQYAERRDSCEQAARELGVTSLREVPVDELEESLGRAVDRPAATAGPARRDRDRARARDGGGAAPQRLRRGGRRSSSPRTPRCATTSRSRSPSSTPRSRRPSRPGPWARG